MSALPSAPLPRRRLASPVSLPRRVCGGDTGRVGSAAVTANLTRSNLADHVADAIWDLAGRQRLRVGDSLPPVIHLSDEFQVSRAVVRDALEQLASRGVIERQQARRWVLAVAPARRRSSSAPTAVPRLSLSEQAADAVLDLILDQGVQEGEPLPPSGELAQRLGVSLTVMREALASLAARGILHRRQGRESVVALPSHELVGSILRVRAHLDGISVDEFQAARASLEAQAAALAATVATREEREAAISGPLEGMRNARNEEEFNDNDLDFHMAIVELSGNKAIVLLLASLHSIVRVMLGVSYRRVRSREGKKGIATALENHERVAAAILAGDPAAAAAAMFDHFEFVAHGATASDHTH